MPLQQPNASLVAVQLDEWLRQRASQSSFGNLPDSHDRILGCRGDHVVVEGIPLNIEDRSLVTSNEGRIDVDASRLEPTRIIDQITVA